MATQRTAAIYVGIFVIAGLLVLMWFSLELGGNVLGRDRLRAHAVFQEVQGLSAGNPVTLRGVEVGRVGDLSIDPQTGRPRVSLLLDPDRDLRGNLIARIIQPNLMGARQIDLTYPPEGPAEARLESGAVLTTQEQFDLLTALSELGEFSGDIRGLIDHIDENQERAFGAFTALIEDNRPRVDRILTQMDEAVPEARQTLSSVREVADALHGGEGTLARLIGDPALADDIQRSAANMRAITGRMATAEGTLWRLIEEDALHGDLEASLANLRESTEAMNALFAEDGPLRGLGDLAEAAQAAMPDLRATLENSREITRKINEGEGTIGRLVNDPALHEELRRVLRRVSETFEEAEETGVIRTFLAVFFGAFV